MKKNFLLLTILCVVSTFSQYAQLEMTEVKSLYNKRGAVADALDDAFLSNIKRIFELEAFVETGTFLGESAARAAKYFKEVHTIELDTNLYNISKSDLSIYPNVICHLGDSAKVMPSILKTLQLKSLFWLDGHYSGTCHAGFNTGLGDEVTPIFAELQAIEQSGMKNAVILIDDIRCFDTMLPITNKDHLAVAGYPDILTVLPAIKKINPHYTFKMFGDTLFAFVDNVKTSPLIDACTISRLYQEGSYSLGELFNAEQYLARSSGKETRILDQLYENSKVESVYTQYGCNKHYVLWRALRLLYKNPSEAYKLFEYVQKIGLNHWRVKWYMAQALLKINNASSVSRAKKLINECKSTSPAVRRFLDSLKG